MAELNLSIPDLFQRAFPGLRQGKPYDGGLLTEDVAQDIEYTEPNAAGEEGTEFLSVREQVGGRLYDGRPMFMPVSLGGILLQHEPTIFLSKRKIVTETSLVGSKRKGSVKELIRSDDWELTIRGIAVNTKSTQFYPEDQVQTLSLLDSIEGSIEIESALTNLLGIYRVVIYRITLPEMVGIQHAQAYELFCVQDEDFILEIE
jgi:hypothetical protein